MAVATLAGVAAAFVVLLSGSPAPKAAAAQHAIPVTAVAAAVSSDDLQDTAVVRHEIATLAARIVRSKAAARRRHHAATAVRPAQQPSPQTVAQPTPKATPAPTAGSGEDAANSPLGVCIRDAEEGGSYAWGPGNGGGAYQFALGTWEKYGGAASEFGVADAAYQNQIFDNAIAEGGASNWTAYDGC